jgi:hypothetical protein
MHKFCIFFSELFFSFKKIQYRRLLKGLSIILLLKISNTVCYGQEKKLDMKLSLDYSSIRLDELLNIIGEKTGKSFTYITEQIPVNKIISIHAINKKVVDILDELLKGTEIFYSERTDQIVLYTIIKSAKKFTISGYIYDKSSGEFIVDAIIYLDSIHKGILSNAYGFYSLTLAEGIYKIEVRHIGYASFVQKITLNENSKLTIQLDPVRTQLNEVTIAPSSTLTVESGSFLQESIDPSSPQVKNMPYLGGEEDIIKALLLLPGIKRNSNGTSNMSARGGETDQNYITIDEAPVYTISHLLGFFSVFNSDVVNDIKFIKDGFSANYGSRLSSIMDVKLKEGDMQKFRTDGSIGLVSSRLTLQGPILKNKMSFIVSGRQSYVDRIVSLYYKGQRNIPFNFYDLNGKFNYKLSERDHLFISGYLGGDAYVKTNSTMDGSNFKVGNFTSTVRWNHLFKSMKLFSNISFIHTRSNYIEEFDNFDNTTATGSGIQDTGLKTNFSYYKNPDNHFSFGSDFMDHHFTPSYTRIINSFVDSSFEQKKILRTQEISLFCFHEYTYKLKWKINYGLRFSLWHTSDHTYKGLEPRLAITRLLTPLQTIKISFSRMQQYIFSIPSTSNNTFSNNNTFITVWYPVSGTFKPKLADQLAVSYTKKISKLKSMLTLESYYVKMHHLLDFKDGLEFYGLNDLENKLVSGEGTSYGIECTAEMNSKRFTGLVSYSLSKSTRQFEEINRGKTYLATGDRRHNLSILLNYTITKHWFVSTLWTYATGTRFTPIRGGFLVSNSTMTQYDIIKVLGEKNSEKMPPSHHLDINLIWRSTTKKKWRSEWNIGAYNVYNQLQPEYVSLEEFTPGNYKYVVYGFFGFVPSIAYKFSF